MGYISYNVLENNRWFISRPRAAIVKHVSFKPTEIFGRDAILPYCNKRGEVSKPFSNHLHSPHCPNYFHESVEVLGQYNWMNKEFLVKSRFKLRD